MFKRDVDARDLLVLQNTPMTRHSQIADMNSPPDCCFVGACMATHSAILCSALQIDDARI
jgi:hypothetical protein